MQGASRPAGISAIVPTIGRPESLRRLLESLCLQTVRVDEVWVADASATQETLQLAQEEGWRRRGLAVTHLAVQPPNAVRQRMAAIGKSTGELLLLLDDDVELEP